MSKKTIKLPPKPASIKKNISPSAPVEQKKDPRDIKDLKVTSYIINFEDGTSLRAEGELANVIYQYLNQCERICAEQQLVTYLGPSFGRYDQDGKLMAQGSPVAEFRR